MEDKQLLTYLYIEEFVFLFIFLSAIVVLELYTYVRLYVSFYILRHWFRLAGLEISLNDMEMK